MFKLKKLLNLVLCVCFSIFSYLPVFAETKQYAYMESNSTNGVTLTVEWNEPVLGQPTTFYVSATGGSDAYKFRMDAPSYSNPGENAYEPVADSSRGEWQNYTNECSSTEYSFTMTASGTYNFKFYVMDAVSNVYYLRVNTYIQVSDAAYPSIDSIVQSAVTQCKQETDGSDYQKALWLHDWLLNQLEYDNSLQWSSAESALTRGSGTCQAYESAYSQLLTAADIENAETRDTYDGHTWNAVKLDGEWYQVDCTWDDTDDHWYNFDQRHLYFGLTDELMAIAHPGHSKIYTSEDYITHSTSLENNYFVQNGDAKKWAQEFIGTHNFGGHLSARETQFTIPADNASYPPSISGIQNRIIAYGINHIDPRLWMNEEETIQIHADANSTEFYFTANYINNIPDQKCGPNATWRLEGDGKLIISGSGIVDGIDWYKKNDLYNYLKDKAKSIIVEEGITEIQGFSFCEFEYLRDVRLPGTMKKIPEGLFENCSRLKEITYSENLTEIGDYAFYGCSLLEKVEFPSSLSKIGSFAFDDCSLLKEVYLPQNCELSKNYVFESSTIITIDSFNSKVGKSLTQKDFTKFYPWNIIRSKTNLNFGFYIMENEEGKYYLAAKKYYGDQNHIEIPDEVDSLKTEWVYEFAIDDTVSSKELMLPESVKKVNYGFTKTPELMYVPKNVEEFEGYYYGNIQCYKGSAAEEYAKRHNNKIEYVEDMDEEYVGHNYVKKDDIPPGCTTEGEQGEVTCSICGKILKGSVSIPPTGHSYSTEWVIDKESSCTEEGEKSHHCLNCNARKDVTSIPVKEHVYSWFETKPETCTEEGYQKYQCVFCGKEKIDVYPPLGHDWYSEVILCEPTISEKGTKVFYCSRCEETKKEYYEQTGLMRLYGNTRYETMNVLLNQGINQADTVIVCSGLNFPDALSASSLAGKNSPILLTDPNELSLEVSIQIGRLNPKQIYVIGGEAAVSTGVFQQLQGMVSNVQRISGQTRYETSLELFKLCHEKNPNSDTVIIATGTNFADALSISSYASYSGNPIVLCDPTNGVDSTALNLIQKYGYTKAIIVGGNNAVPVLVEKQLSKYGCVSINRLSGTTRYETSIEIAKYGEKHGLSMNGAMYVTGKNYPDALAAGPIAGSIASNLLLIDEEKVDESYLGNYKTKVTKAYVIGGENAVSYGAMASVANALNIEIHN